MIPRRIIAVVGLLVTTVVPTAAHASTVPARTSILVVTPVAGTELARHLRIGTTIGPVHAAHAVDQLMHTGPPGPVGVGAVDPAVGGVSAFLPSTGNEVGALEVVGAVGLMGLGAVLMIASRRRRRD